MRKWPTILVAGAMLVALGAWAAQSTQSQRLGTLFLDGSTSGSAKIQAQAAAGTPALVMPTGSGTLASSATSPIALSATTGAISCPTCVTSQAGQLIGYQIITTTGAYTYSPSTGTNFVIVELQGAGGGGAGVAVPGAAKTSLGGGGNAGYWGRKLITSGFSGASGSVGAKGGGGSAGANAGTAGGVTTFVTTTSVTYSVPGGGGAGSASGLTPPAFVGNNSGTNGSFSANFDSFKPGMGANEGISLSTALSFSGCGGSSVYGSGGAAIDLVGTVTQSAGAVGVGKGSGGSGAVASTTGTAQAGGDGTDGVVIIWEYR